MKPEALERRPQRRPPPRSTPAPEQADQTENLGRLTMLDIQSLEPFTYRWPKNVEAFDRGWDFTIRFGWETARARIGIGHRVVYGADRVHTVTWLNGQPTVEGVAADDYAETGGLISLLRIGGRAMVRHAHELPSGYAGFRIVRHAAEIRAPYTRKGLAVKLAEDDLLGWARHALLRARAKRAKAPADALPVAPAARPAPTLLMPPPSANQQAIVASLLAHAQMITAQPWEEPSFSPNPDANRLVIDDPFAFLVAVIFDQGMKAEWAWTSPYNLKLRLGHLDPVRIAADPQAVERAVKRPPALLAT